MGWARFNDPQLPTNEAWWTDAETDSTVQASIEKMPTLLREVIGRQFRLWVVYFHLQAKINSNAQNSQT